MAQYGVPPKSVQPGSGTQLGDFPQGQCLNIPACATAILLGVPDPFTEVVSELDSNDSRMQQTWYANGKLWGALDTQVTVGGESRAGIVWFIVDPSVPKLVKSGTLALENNNVSYPAIATTAAGRGVMAFTLVGEDHFASAAYASIDAKVGVGDIHIAGAGLGLDDGFTSYKAQVGDPPRTRWGDYGAAALDGKNIWIASEYIGQSCTLTQWLAAPIGSCGGTRTALGQLGHASHQAERVVTPAPSWVSASYGPDNHSRWRFRDRLALPPHHGLTITTVSRKLRWNSCLCRSVVLYEPL